MFARSTLIAIVTAVAALTTLPGCAVFRDQSTVGEFIDDATVTTQIKARMVESKEVNAGAISVETLNGEVTLSGFAKSSQERDAAARIARGVKGAKKVNNAIVVRS